MISTLLCAILLDYIHHNGEESKNSIAGSESHGHVNPDIDTLRHDYTCSEFANELLLLSANEAYDLIYRH
jgi:hypothetical protein